MKVRLEYNLPEDRDKLDAVLDTDRYKMVVDEFQLWLASCIYGGNGTQLNQEGIWQKWRDIYNEYMGSKG